MEHELPYGTKTLYKKIEIFCPPNFFNFFFGKFRKNKIKISDVFGFFIFCIVFEIFKVKKWIMSA